MQSLKFEELHTKCEYVTKLLCWLFVPLAIYTLSDKQLPFAKNSFVKVTQAKDCGKNNLLAI